MPLKKDIATLNPHSNIAVATLWTMKDVVVKRLGGAAGKVNTVGTLYTRRGINYLLQTLGEHTEIDTLIVFGSDLSGSGEALVRLFTRGEADGFRLAWPIETIRPILERVRLIDLRDAFKAGDWDALRRAVEENYRPAGPRDAPLHLEIVEPEGVESWPIQLSGHLVFEYSLFRAWVKVVDAAMRLGYVKETEYGERQKQLLNVVVTLKTPREPSLERRFTRYIPADEFKRHVDSLLTPERPRGTSYTYGERLRAHPAAGDQLQLLIDKLASSPSTRRAVAVTWLHGVDGSSENPPCLLLIQGDVTGGRYNHTAYFRSHDLYRGWPLNAYGQLVLAHRIAAALRDKGLDVEPGFITIISGAAHVYEHDWGDAARLLEEEARAAHAAFVPDPRGNFHVYVEGGGVVVEHRDPLDRLAARYVVRDPRRLAERLGLDSLLSMPSHAAYLAREVTRAWMSLRIGKEYVQDKV